MTITIKLFFTILTASLILGCSNEYKKELLKEELKSELNTSTTTHSIQSATETIEVNAENFKISKNIIPDNEQIKRVKIIGAQLSDVIALITEATSQNIIFQLQSDTQDGNNQSNNRNRANLTNNVNQAVNNSYGLDESSDEYQIRKSKVYVSASNIGFGRLLRKAVGDKLSIRYDDDTYYLGSMKTITLKIPSLTGLADKLKKTLETIGAINVVHDSITSSVTFSAKEKEYQDIMKYLEILRNNLYVIEYDIAIYNVELTDNYSLGINWNLMPTGTNDGIVSNTAPELGSVGAVSTTSSLGAIFSTVNLSGSMIAEALTKFGKVESIQRPKLLGIAGTDVTLVDGLNEPYIKELRTTAIGDNAAQTSTVSASALSGIKVTLNSNIMDGTVLTDISLEINDIVGYSNFEVNSVSYTQPRVHTKNIKSSMRVQPGVPIVISGLFKNKSDKGYKGLPGVASTQARLLGGTEYKSSSKTEMVIIVTPRVIKYVMK
ncbi:MAG: hypothetical protein KAR81_03225 [Sulfurimonas sp.]|nr:hypothetical protein [Sulfurimonas sp.]